MLRTLSVISPWSHAERIDCKAFIILLIFFPFFFLLGPNPQHATHLWRQPGSHLEQIEFGLDKSRLQLSNEKASICGAASLRPNNAHNSVGAGRGGQSTFSRRAEVLIRSYTPHLPSRSCIFFSSLFVILFLVWGVTLIMMDKAETPSVRDRPKTTEGALMRLIRSLMSDRP